ncbi:MarR family winged helix-turn-helix transcriptional regulator [Capillimicrobium parvum]|uniref:HTH-type transcriptional regulator n=1 Tax=Capillimicrobium parvum TaxID=2884022 RepID=A0A9E6XU67_9ACTN|nr:MarR family transcriptional regulator [Capillimicrobium parvum]UGS34577.1 putative HTH-type transcriptional regulator [Capillimicrobium parvum]
MATSSRSARTDTAARLRLAIVRTSRRMRQEAGGGLSPSQAAALATVDRHGPLTPSELAAHERVQRPTVARLLARMEEDGLVTRAPDPSDGRSSLISISEDGRALLESVRSRKDAFLAQRMEALDADERATLERAATIIERMLEA